MLKTFLTSMAVVAALAAPYMSDGMAAETGFTPQVINERGIKLTVVLQDISDKADTWDFAVTLETHTQALGDDLAKSSVLIADGKEYLPLAWEGASPGGHHRKGSLRFKAIVPQPKSVELQIRLANDSSPRVFKWLLK